MCFRRPLKAKPLTPTEKYLVRTQKWGQPDTLLAEPFLLASAVENCNEPHLVKGTNVCNGWKADMNDEALDCVLMPNKKAARDARTATTFFSVV